MSRKKKKRSSNSVLVQSLQAQPRPGQPLFSLIVFFSIIIDMIRVILKSVLCLIVIIVLSVFVVCTVAFVTLKPEYDEYMANAEKTVEETTPDTFRFNETTVLYYSDGSRISELLKDSDTVYLEYDSIGLSGRIRGLT